MRASARPQVRAGAPACDVAKHDTGGSGAELVRALDLTGDSPRAVAAVSVCTSRLWVQRGVIRGQWRVATEYPIGALTRAAVVYLCLAVAIVVVVSGCAGAAVTDGGYRAKTAGTLNDVASALATAKLVMRLDARGRTVLALTDQSVSEAESDAASAQSSWESRQPPSDASLKLHDQVEQPIQDAVSALEDLRIAQRRADRDAVTKALNEMDKANQEVARQIQAMSG
jgi:hypothetical protein